MNSSNSGENRRRRRGILFAVTAVMLGLLPFVLAEVALRAAGLFSPTSYQDPFVGFSRVYPLFELDENGERFQIAQHHHYFFGMESFPAEKAEETFRTFCLGGSTVLGHPYDTPTAFPRWMEIELTERSKASRFEVVNCGGMSYASYRLIPILQEVLNYQPDLVVVMTGHNEFLEDRTYQKLKQRSAWQAWVEDRLFSLRLVMAGRRFLSSRGAKSEGSLGLAEAEADLAGATGGRTLLQSRVDARLDHASGYASYQRDEDWWQAVTEHFELNLKVIVQICREADVPLLLVKPGSNLRDCPPFKSQHGSGLAAGRLATWQELFERAEESELRSPAHALAIYRQAEQIDDQHAQLIYRIARCLDRTGAFEQAGSQYLRAKELDVCPLRIRDLMQQNIEGVALATNTPLVDVAELLDERSEFATTGFDWYVDQVHPSIRGHQLIAQAIVAESEKQRIVEPLGTWSAAQRRKAYQVQMDELGDFYLVSGRRRVEWLESWARRDRMRSDTVPLGLRAELELAKSYYEFAEYQRADSIFGRLLRERPSTAEALLNRALQLFRGGRSAAAGRLLEQVIAAEFNPGGIDSTLLEEAKRVLQVIDEEAR